MFANVMMDIPTTNLLLEIHVMRIVQHVPSRETKIFD